jgi:hypothetical protein
MTELVVPELIDTGDVQGYCDVATGECVPVAPATDGETDDAGRPTLA